MPQFPCQWEDCTLGEGEEEGGRYNTPTNLDSIDQAIKLLEIHTEAHKGILAMKLVKVEQPRIEEEMSEEDWRVFLSDWVVYKESVCLTEEKERVSQLWSCLSLTVKRAASKEGLQAVGTEEEMLHRIEKLVVRTGMELN